MKKYCLIALSAALMLSLIPTLEASPHRHSKHNHRHDDGLALAAGIVHLVRSVIAPPPVVITPRPAVVVPPPPPVVITPRPAVVVPPPPPVVVTPKPVVVVPPRPVVIQPPSRAPQRPLPPPRRRRR